MANRPDPLSSASDRARFPMNTILRSSKFVHVWPLVTFLIGVSLGATCVYFRPSGPDSGGRATALPKLPATTKVASVPLSPPTADDQHIWHVREGMDIQQALDAAAADPSHKVVRVHEGVYRPARHAQAMIFFNARHDGITLEAEGQVTLTAENPEIADPAVASFPAVVNHVVYFGDGISRKTIFRGFRITGARNYLTFSDMPAIETAPALPSLSSRQWTYYADGGGIKIWGRSSPWIDQVLIEDCYSFPCAGAISIDNRGHLAEIPLITNSIFRNNRSQWTGAAIDLFGPGNAGEIRNCLFVGNVANRGYYTEAPAPKFHDQNGSGALTVFPKSIAIVDQCTFTGNYNGVDDESDGSTYSNCIFWKNDGRGGVIVGKRYELDIREGRNVTNCWLGGNEILDLRGTVSRANNVLKAPDPEFDDAYRPRRDEYKGVGYRPVSAPGAGKESP
jgi:hypothetical protein